MGTTPTFAWPYPDLDDSPNVPVDMEALADAADATVDGINDRLLVVEPKTTHLDDTGWVTVTTASAWSSNLNVRKKDGVVYLSGPVTKNGTVTTAGSTSTMVTALATQYRPSLQIECLGQVFLNGTTNQRGTYVIRITTAGAVQVFVTTESGSLPDTGQLRFSVAYPAA